MMLAMVLIDFFSPFYHKMTFIYLPVRFLTWVSSKVKGGNYVMSMA